MLNIYRYFLNGTAESIPETNTHILIREAAPPLPTFWIPITQR